MPNIQQLITEQKRLSGLSYADYEARAKHVISRQRWQQLGSGERIREFSEPATIQAMADALEVDVTLVVIAMAKTIGLPVDNLGGQSELALMMPPAARNFSGDQRDAILRLVRVFAPEPQASPADEPSPASTENHQYMAIRYDTSRPDVITQGPHFTASNDLDAHRQIHRGLELAGVPIDSRSDHIVTVALRGESVALIGVLRDDAPPEREKYLVGKLRERGELMAPKAHAAPEPKQSGADKVEQRPGRRLSTIKGSNDSRVNRRDDGQDRHDLSGGEVV